ncbi:MAG: hypothetical protein LBR81_04230 [Prevotellaceae bacterium]|jgi:hypothetical protein|nr:hypothetical protein [Prevotellaceae bacterium]
MKNTNNHSPKLYQALLLDGVGLLTYLLPVLGDYADIVWAPVSAWLFYRLYGGRLGVFGAAVSFVEEILPWTDFIPTFTIGWIVKKFLKKSKQPHHTKHSVKASH